MAGKKLCTLRETFHFVDKLLQKISLVCFCIQISVQALQVLNQFFFGFFQLIFFCHHFGNRLLCLINFDFPVLFILLQLFCLVHFFSLPRLFLSNIIFLFFVFPLLSLFICLCNSILFF